MNYTLNNLIQKKKSSFLFALAFCLSFPLTGQKYKDFDKVMALYKGRGDYVSAIVLKVHSNGRLDLRYDSGREDTLGKA